MGDCMGDCVCMERCHDGNAPGPQAVAVSRVRANTLPRPMTTGSPSRRTSPRHFRECDGAAEERDVSPPRESRGPGEVRG